jgi:hypothetical protein
MYGEFLEVFLRNFYIINGGKFNKMFYGYAVQSEISHYVITW